MDFFNQFKEKKKKIMQIKVIGGIIAAFLPILLFAVLMVVIVSPLLLYIDKTASIYNEDGTVDRAKRTFENAILDKEEEWNEKGVQIDKELILSVLLYGRSYNYDGNYTIPDDCDIENLDSCTMNNVNPKDRKLIKYAKELADGMVKSETVYSCQNVTTTLKAVCEEEVSFNYFDKLPFPILALVPNNPGGDFSGGGCENPKMEEVTIYGDEKYCGEDSELCDNVCDAGYKLNSKIVYKLKTTDEYIEFLKTDYNLYSKLVEVGVVKANSKLSKEEVLDKAISEIYDIYYLVRKSDYYGSGNFPALTYASGSFNGTIWSWNQCSTELKKAIIPHTSRSYCAGGCGLAATATIISSLSGKVTDPVAIGSTYCNSSLCTDGGTYGFSIAVRAANEHGFSYSSNFSGDNQEMMQEMVNKLAAGNSLVMVRVGAGTISSGYHFIVLTGVNSDGTVTMADSGRPSNSNKSWSLEEVARNAAPGGFMIFSR